MQPSKNEAASDTIADGRLQWAYQCRWMISHQLSMIATTLEREVLRGPDPDARRSLEGKRFPATWRMVVQCLNKSRELAIGKCDEDLDNDLRSCLHGIQGLLRGPERFVAPQVGDQIELLGRLSGRLGGLIAQEEDRSADSQPAGCNGSPPPDASLDEIQGLHRGPEQSVALRVDDPIESIERLSERPGEQVAREEGGLTSDETVAEEGPAPPDAWVYQGQRFRGLTSKPFRFAKLLWEGKRGTWVTFGEIAKMVLQDHATEVSSDQVGNWRRQANAFFREHDIPLKTSVKSCNAIIEDRQSTAAGNS